MGVRKSRGQKRNIKKGKFIPSQHAFTSHHIEAIQASPAQNRKLCGSTSGVSSGAEVAKLTALLSIRRTVTKAP